MKKFLYSLLAIATLGLAAGCQREQSVKEDGPVVDVTFNVSLKGLQTKAFSDGTQAKDLYVAVYANRTEGPVYMESLSTADQPDAFANGLTTTVKFRLVRGENYNIAFWAQAPNAPYTLDKAAGTLTVNTEGVANDEIRDAFYCVWSGTPSATPQDVELRRPFAQINVLTTVEDWSALQLSQIPFAGSSAKVTAPSVLNLITGEATAPKEYDLSFGAIDPEAINIPGYERAYKYVAMNYVLAGTRSTTDLSFSVYRAEQDPLASFDVPNIPYQRNWRTIVWGDIFTMEGEFNVTINPDYEDVIDVNEENKPNDGTANHPYTVAETLAIIDAMDDGGKSPAEVYVSGVISSITEISTQHHNATYYITDEIGSSVNMMVFRGKYLDGADFETGNEIAVGDKVVVCGFLEKYKNATSGDVTPEISQGNKIVSLEHAQSGSTYTVTFGDMTGGSVALATPANGFAEGETVILTVTPDTNYELETLDYNIEGQNNRTPIVKDNTGAYSFVMPAGNVTVNATFKDTGSQPAGSYTKVTSAPEDWSGEYLIVYEDGSVAFNGALTEKLDVAENGIAVTISNGTIASTTAIDNATFTITKMEGGYSVKSHSGIYISGKSGSNTIVESADAVANTITLNEGNAVIASNAASIMYNATSGQMRFRFYKDGTTTQKPVALYKKSAGTTPVTQPTVTGIKVVSLPTKTEYTVGEYINWAGFKANAILSDQTERELASNEIVHDRNDAFADTDISDACVVNIYYFDGTDAQMNITTSFTVKVVAAQPAANDGSQAHPFTVAEVRDFIDGLKGAVSENEVYVAGKIASIANNGQFSASFGNASFFISDDGQASSDQFEAYRVLYLGRKKWVEGDATIKVGDDVVICGKVKLYSPSNGDPVYETHQSNADNYNGYLYSLNGQTEIVNTTPVITASDISGVSADGATNATAEVTVTNVDNTWTLSATGDGTVVTSASWDGSTLSYTVSANTGAARQGKITLKVTKGDTEISKEITVSQLAGTSTLGEYESNVSWEAVDACYTDNKITVNGTADVANLKFGTSSKFGKANITLPPGTTKVTFYAVAWKGNPATMKFTVGETAYSFNIAANDGATNTAPYTLNVSATDDKYTLTLNAALTVQTVVTVETCAGETYSGKRAFLFGVQAAK